MIALHHFGPAFGVPDPSSFCIKAMVLLKMADLAFTSADGDPRKSPKGKTPWIVDDGQAIADTTLIRFHLEDKYGIDFDQGLDERERGVAWAFEKLCEDHLYWLMMHDRWLIDANFKAGPVHFFDAIPMPLRPIVTKLVRRNVRRDLHGQGLSRHNDAERERIARRGFDALAAQLGDKPFMMGETPTSVDAAVFGIVVNALTDVFETPQRTHVQSQPNLIAYRDRGLALWFPDFAA